MSFFHEVYYVAWGDLRYMRHTFKNILISSLVTPILYLLAFGYGLRVGADVGGVPYIDFVIPGVIALSCLSSSFAATSTRLNVQRLYYRCFDEMMMCPLSNPAIICGKALIGVCRGLLSSALIFTIGWVLEPSYLFLTPLLILTVILASFTFSMLGVMCALLARSHAAMTTFSSLVITPMTFLCGTFFAIDSLPAWAQGVLYCLPLSEASSCIRAAALGFDFPFWALGVLALFFCIFFSVNLYLIKNRKI
ncbi:MAG: ABC transporter permease [archaeon]|nr:ABC transporter permease [archaeon]